MNRLHRHGRVVTFRYRGVHITFRKISVLDCVTPVHKLITKVGRWGLRTLSYASRVQLINSVFMPTHVYWAFIFLLPRAVLKRIIAICRNYLWDRKVETTRVLLVARDLVYRSKREGGLAMTDCVSWNDAAIGKYCLESK